MKGVFQWRSSSSKKCCRSATSAIQTRGAGSFSKVQVTQAQAEDTQVDWEAALVQRACTGDARAFERLYREHAGRVYGLCLRMTRDVHLAEDCTQETFINARRSRVDTRDPGGGAGDRGRDRCVARRRTRCARAACVVWLFARGSGPDAVCGGGHVQGPVAPGPQTVAREIECGGE